MLHSIHNWLGSLNITKCHLFFSIVLQLTKECERVSLGPEHENMLFFLDGLIFLVIVLNNILKDWIYIN